MNKIRYLFQRIAGLNYKKFLETARIVSQRTGRWVPLILLDMMLCAFRYTAGYMDYLIFEFYRLNAKERATYVTRGENNRIVALLNQKEYWDMFEDKTKFNQAFAPFLGRKWLDLRYATEEEFAEFLTQVEKIAVKPIDGICGRGIEFYTTSEITDPKAFYHQLVENNQRMVDEFIVQHSQLSLLYPQSVNTIRLVTILKDGVVHLVFSGLRVGNGKQVDNLNSGGMAAVIDGDTATIVKPAADKDGHAYDCHPATGTSFLGFQVPLFHQAVAMVKQAALVVPQVGYVGWDVAVREHDVLLIEANHFPGNDIYQFQVQLEDKMGLLPRFRKALEEV